MVVRGMVDFVTHFPLFVLWKYRDYIRRRNVWECSCCEYEWSSDDVECNYCKYCPDCCCCDECICGSCEHFSDN